MLEIKNTEVYGLERSIMASGNPMSVGEINTVYIGEISRKEHDRAISLGSAERGSGHDNFLSGITVYFDVKYPLYWSPEFQRYHFFEIISSQSTMHRLTVMGKDENFENMFNKYVDKRTIEIVKEYINEYNNLVLFVSSEDDGFTTETNKIKIYEAFMKVRSNLPSGFEMWMTIRTNYLQLKTIYYQRRNHKLKEDWGAFCDWIEKLPYFKEMVLKEN